MKPAAALIIVYLTVLSKLAGQDRSSGLNRFFSVLSANQQFNGTILVAEDGKIVYQNSFGFADFSTRRRNENNSVFPVASITKSFTALAIMQLSEKGKIGIDDPAAKYLPGFPYPAITIRHLLSHTSGLQPYDNLFDSIRTAHPDTVFTNKDIVARYSSTHPTLFYKPGDDCNYDNVNYILLSLVVEKASGISYRAYIRKNIMEKAGMRNSKLALYNDHYTPAEKKKLSVKYWYPHLYSDRLEMADTIDFVQKYWRCYNFKGFGELISTAADLLKFDDAFYNGKLIKQETIKEMITPVTLNNGEPNPGNRNGSSFGLGWIINADSSFGKVIRASGGAIGLRSSFVRNISRRQTIIIFDNTQNETDEIAKAVLAIMNGHAVKPYGRSLAKEFGRILVNESKEPALSLFEKVEHDTVNYVIREEEFNTLGYDFMSKDKKEEALLTFRLNTELFPQSWNVFDSYGEALLKYGRKKEAILMYRKSVALNPQNENGKKALAEMLK